MFLSDLRCGSSWFKPCLDQNQVAGRDPSGQTSLVLPLQCLPHFPYAHRVPGTEFATRAPSQIRLRKYVKFWEQGAVCLFEFALFLLLLLVCRRWDLLVIYLICVPVIQGSKMHVSK